MRHIAFHEEGKTSRLCKFSGHDKKRRSSRVRQIAVDARVSNNFFAFGSLISSANVYTLRIFDIDAEEFRGISPPSSLFSPRTSRGTRNSGERLALQMRER